MLYNRNERLMKSEESLDRKEQRVESTPEAALSTFSCRSTYFRKYRRPGESRCIFPPPSTDSVELRFPNLTGQKNLICRVLPSFAKPQSFPLSFRSPRFSASPFLYFSFVAPPLSHLYSSSLLFFPLRDLGFVYY